MTRTKILITTGCSSFKITSSRFRADRSTQVNYVFVFLSFCLFLPARASEQGNVIGLVSVYIYVYKKKFVIERTRDLIYLKFVVTDFSPKIISPCAGENSSDSA